MNKLSHMHLTDVTPNPDYWDECLVSIHLFDASRHKHLVERLNIFKIRNLKFQYLF